MGYQPPEDDTDDLAVVDPATFAIIWRLGWMWSDMEQARRWRERRRRVRQVTLWSVAVLAAVAAVWTSGWRP